MHSTIAAPELSMQFSHDYVVLEMFCAEGRMWWTFN